MRKRLLLLAVGAGLAASPARGGEPDPRSPGKEPGKADATASLPKAGKELLGIYKNLLKTRSYSVSVSIEGGLSDNAEHRVTQANVRESYDGEVFRGARGQMMHVPGLQAFRTPAAGATKMEGLWKSIVAIRETTLMHRLFAFPETLLERAARHQAGAQWVEGDVDFVLQRAEKAESEEDEESIELDDESDEDAGAAPEESEPRRGKTVVGGGSGKSAAGKSSSSLRLPRVIRVEAPPKEALVHFTEVESSGCFGGG